SKIKKDEGHLELVLERTEDILAWIGKRRRPGQVIAGFALETEEGLESARGKLERKGLDLVVLNSLQDEGAGFGHATNKVTLVTRDKDPERLPLLPKAEVARRILDAIERRLKG
ncbi:MAG: phosphopantothenoylcysteine decarboxylase, partial [Flavobacteriales bacterium]|nr:phosphopantothenoylcysteine decarboxylase [Flavobacteriales bacterium]MCB0782793.1 phosphopantothenoylcysteine decarboxylase [Flavobacteriales bacterium]MCB0812516.1 phosphopantothenoylcysteine decarboxylase [Flavobacteriales bacterium]